MTAPPTFREAFRFWLKLGFISFGGPTGQIAIMHTELVERKNWVDEQRFLHALNYCMLLPGPEATQLATYCGWLLHGTRGGIVAGVLFVLPAAVLLWALSWIYVAYGTLPAMTAIFHGLKPAVTAIVVAAVITIGRRALKSGAMWAIAGAAFAAIFFWRAPFPLIVALAALVGWVGAGRFASNPKPGNNPEALPVAGAGSSARGAGWQRLAGTLALGLALWWAPVAVAGLTLGWESVLVREGVFFSKAAMVTFGGAYAVLPYVTNHAVEHHQWLTAPQMMDGLGLAETTPGPLIMVLQFVGFLGGWNQPGALPPLAMATLGAAMTTWTTFVPAYLWIFLGAPYIEALRGYAKLGSALAAVTAAVVGVILNLAVWFGVHVFFPAAGVVDRFAVGVAVAAFVALQFLKVGMMPVVLLSGLAGWLWSLL